MTGKRYADLILTNARVLTMEPGTSDGNYVAVADGRILHVGHGRDASQFRGPGTVEIDCQGMTLLPGFIDAHCHLMALASSRRSVDCRPSKVGSIADIVHAIRQRAEKLSTSRTVPADRGNQDWIRAFGYDEFFLSEKRHPTRWDLDRAAPFHPMRLDHRTGHASVLNSAALQLVNIHRDTPDPDDGIIERDEVSGEPTGVLYEMGDYIREMTHVQSDDESFWGGVASANELLLSRGITSIQDAGVSNDYRRWQTLQSLKEQGLFTPRVTMMVGVSHVSTLLEAGLKPDDGNDDLRVGAVKLMVGLTTGSLQPPVEEIVETVLSTHRQGYQLAIHAVEEEVVEAVIDSLLMAQAQLPRPDARHRIEHCSECPPRLLTKLKESRALVVTQPGFIYEVGEKYLSEVERRLLPSLYPVSSLVAAGIPVAAGSDGPVTEPDPITSIYSAVTRNTRNGSILGSSQAVPANEALRIHTINAAYAAFEEQKKGSITTGKLADLVLLDAHPTAVEPKYIKEINVVMTVVGGQIVWQR